MNQSEFRKLRISGQLLGATILLMSVVLMFVQGNGLYLLGGYAIFWLVNYGIIHGYIGARYVRDD